MDAKNNNDNIAKAPTDREEWIAVRRSALYDYFNLPEKNKAEAEALFDKMRALTAECADQGEFETRLAQSPLNKPTSSPKTAATSRQASAWAARKDCTPVWQAAWRLIRL